ncbi:transcriptional regulator/sugar kinase [Sphaerochaeta pleomorpha str. Grapes]|uniref:Transcriptional regulator/sugar kinase n=1 Tax=Sphaerochaeta pleomorpha (strain ATCC BAA-1885 / DSM 22778 / Grapes) TaxID=158190 RepID=G8QTC6_SPHPG|nr:ROK family protein [Sphaerochaeta pleomorpha]AEV29093.1 transcriptional regulator/sugar kinase [Sphaerochaeta pleomorpha str. Grapes]
MGKELFLGIDIGGTKTSVSLGSSDGVILAKNMFATSNDPQEVIEEICIASIQVMKANKVSAGGISCGGPLDAEQGLILSPPNLPSWDKIPICSILSSRLGIPFFLENDANACALAEWYWGNGRGTQNMVFLTFGTGFGAGLILNGRLYRGTNGQAGEIGHIRSDESGPFCYGKNGSFESFCSGTGISLLFEQNFRTAKTAKEICALADSGDVFALTVVRESASHLGLALSLLIDLLNPEKIIIGSIYQRNEKLFNSIANTIIDNEALELNRQCCKIVPSALAEQLGDLAALGIAKDHWRTHA